MTSDASLSFITSVVSAGNFVFYNNGVVLFTLHPDGSIERGPGFTTNDEMSLEFWKAIERMRPRTFCLEQKPL